MATRYPSPRSAEPSERWKADLKARIDENLENLLKDAKTTYEQKVSGTRQEDYSGRRKFYLEYLQTTENLKSFAADEYTYALEREKQELSWLFAAQPTEEDDELEALKEKQFAILNSLREEPPLTRPQPSAQPTLDHVDPFGFTEFASLSPIFTPTPLLAVAESAEYESETDSSRTPSPSPPSTPPLSSCNASTTASSIYWQVPDSVRDEEERLRRERTPSPSPPSTPAKSSTTPSIYWQTPSSVKEEEVRLRAERQAEQQEEFHRKAEEIRRRNQEKKLKASSDWVDPTDTPFAPSDDESSRYTSSTSTSTTSSSFNSPAMPPPVPLEPFLIAPKSEEDLIRLFIFHDQQWTRIESYKALQWSDFPWPVLNFIGPRSERELTMPAISEYILSAFDWKTDKARSKERLREHIRKWHPDRFEARFLSRVPDGKGERDRVRAGAGLVVRHLTELLGQFNDLKTR
ncbi:hypothetical protein DFP72DRAFT_212972 [Ephemerocybe angulata]|uniref:Uncharacterized protein n=1 Tax=Ephemerocybe angulata TaxID=980116 RepID=A0A8H6I631_9AGAR|nr:hypothetical protein DFP72DRAFT_212972 [Tulosesus angulatus]